MQEKTPRARFELSPQKRTPTLPFKQRGREFELKGMRQESLSTNPAQTCDVPWLPWLPHPTSFDPDFCVGHNDQFVRVLFDIQIREKLFQVFSDS